jgi:predicted transcriptional regulator of viral defense system
MVEDSKASAAEHLDFTDQIFNSTLVFTSRKVPRRKLNYKGANFTIKTVKPERIFGCQSIWIENHKVHVSDPTRTIVDEFNDPVVVGGIRTAVDILNRYLRPEYTNLDLLFQYSTQMKNTAIFKRLGFIFEQYCPEETTFIEKIRKEVKSGHSQLDPSTPGKSLVTA